MDYADRLEQVAVLGAAGKMGSGIVLLTSLEMAELALRPEHRSRTFVLHAVDISNQALSGLVKYVREQARKAAEKRVVALRQAYADRADLVSNEEIVEQYVTDVVDIVRPTTTLAAAAEARVVFEAAPEDLELKLRLLEPVATDNPAGPWVFTNTSSIPIAEIDERARLGGRIMGFHFYNPPAVQKLVELIPAATTRPEVAGFAEVLAKNLRKTVVHSRDVAGFIGNGHFMRDLLFGAGEVERLQAQMPFVEAVYTVNRVSQDFLVRPMGIFQLVDYVGLDVCQCILRVMDARLPERLHSPLIDRLLAAGVKGGQNHDGSQKDGFLQYAQGKPTAAYDPAAGSYVPFAGFQAACDQRLGPLPEPPLPWKAAVRHPAREEALADFFRRLGQMETLGADLAERHGARSREIGERLVADGVAHSPADVNQVLLTGFFHVYGPINDYFSLGVKR
ncbi:MAG: 3-hydroxyacyl-CoA dehydrogenase family protein [Acidobacteria bacterium]|nr:MAG: 3-hydroxyacyl-CoA dehydrogenase family protein [Acidobacteriota bacterium]